MFASRSYFHYRILGKRIPFLCQTNLSLSLSLRSPLLSPRDREHVSNVSECSRGEENTGGVFSRAPSPPRQIDFHRDRDWKAAGPDNRKPGLRVYADFSFHGAAYADAVVFPVRPRGRRRVCLSTSGPRDIPPILFYVHVYMYTPTFALGT